MKKNIFITRPIPSIGIDYLKKHKNFNVIVRKKDSVISRRELLKSVKGMDAVLSILTDNIDSEVMDAAGKQLKIVANYAVGFNNLDVKAAQKRNVILTNTPAPELSDAVADHAIALMLALAHRIVEADRFTRAGKYHGWGPTLLLGTDLHKKTIGIIGFGRIGQAVAKRAAGFDIKVLYNSPRQASKKTEKACNAKKVSLETLLKQSDFVSIHVPLLPSTKYLIKAKQLNMMKKTAFIINTARGPIIKEKALLDALEAGKIAGAGLDVYECEPLTHCDPRDHTYFRKMDNVIMTPHTASASMEARGSMSLMAAKNIAAVLKGKKPINPVFVN